MKVVKNKVSRTTFLVIVFTSWKKHIMIVLLKCSSCFFMGFTLISASTTDYTLIKKGTPRGFRPLSDPRKLEGFFSLTFSPPENLNEMSTQQSGAIFFFKDMHHFPVPSILQVIPSRERIHIPPWEKEHHLQMQFLEDILVFWRVFVSSHGVKFIPVENSADRWVLFYFIGNKNPMIHLFSESPSLLNKSVFLSGPSSRWKITLLAQLLLLYSITNWIHHVGMSKMFDL